MRSGTLETRDLRLVLAIAEAGGATQAAKLLHLSQSAVSHQLRGLEERLGLPLFRRDGRRLAMTAAAERLVALAPQVLEPLLRAELELKRGLHPERIKLRVGTQCYTAYHWLPKALTTLAAEHPEVELVLSGEGVNDAAQAIDEGRFDLVLCVIPPKRGKLTRVPLFEDELMLALPPGHPLGRKPYVEGRDLEGLTLIQSNTSELERERVQRLIFGDAAPQLRVMRVAVAEAVLDLVQAGLGVSIVAGFTLVQRVERGELMAVRLTRRGLRRRWSGVFRSGSALTAASRTLLGTLKARGLPRK